MFTITPGSQVNKLITILAQVGEFPFTSLSLIGNRNSLYNLCYKLSRIEKFKFPDSDEIIQCQLLKLSCKGKLKSIRFHRSGLEVLRRLNYAAYKYYLETYNDHHLQTDMEHVTRNHRIAEAIVMCMNAGIESRGYLLSPLSNSNRQIKEFTQPACYQSKALKKIDVDGLKKTMYARIVGVIFYQTGCYALYNVRDTLMKWKPESEHKVALYLEGLCALNTNFGKVSSAVFIGADYSVALRMLNAWKGSSGRKIFTSVYSQIHFIPINDYGTKLLQIMTLPDWNEKLLRLLFRHSERSYGYGDFPYDARKDGIYVLSFLDSDIARLYKFRQYLQKVKTDRWMIYCFREQVGFLKAYLGEDIQMKSIDLEKLISLLPIERRELI